jgi:hypothetical protein
MRRLWSLTALLNEQQDPTWVGMWHCNTSRQWYHKSSCVKDSNHDPTGVGDSGGKDVTIKECTEGFWIDPSYTDWPLDEVNGGVFLSMRFHIAKSIIMCSVWTMPITGVMAIVWFQLLEHLDHRSVLEELVISSSFPINREWSCHRNTENETISEMIRCTLCMSRCQQYVAWDRSWYNQMITHLW